MRTVLLMISVVALGACSPNEKPVAPPAAAPASSGDAGREIEALRAEVARLAAENAQLRATPAALAAEVEAAVKAGNPQAAQEALKRLMDRYPASPEVNPSIQRVSAFVTRLRAEQDEARRVASLGFKGLKVNASFTHGETTLTVGSAAVGRTWTYDSYGTGWKYVEAEKGKRFVMARATVTSKNKEPSPFGVAAYVPEGASLVRVGIMRYRFARWTDFGSYLGNHADYRNDFAHTSSVAFSLGVAGGDEQLARRPIYLVATREGCHTRTFERLAQPPVHYVPGACLTLKPTLTLDDFRDGSLAVVKRID